MSFSDVKIATEIRDLIVRMVRREVGQMHPPATYGEVVSFDRRALTAEVIFAGSTTPVTVRMGAVQPQTIGQKVRVCPRSGDYFLESVIGPGFLIGIAGAANTLRGGEEENGMGVVLGRGEDGNTILNGTVPPTWDIGRSGDFYIDTSVFTIYGPKVDDQWGDGTSMVGA